MKMLCPCVVCAIALLVSFGCAKKKEVSSLDLKQAANLVSEAQFATTLRDYPRAETLFQQATSLAPDDGDYWIALGNVEVRLGKRDAARKAYKQALAVFEQIAAKNKSDSQPALQQVYVLALLGRADDARALQAKLSGRYPGDRDVRAFVEGNRLERMLADPQFKSVAL